MLLKKFTERDRGHNETVLGTVLVNLDHILAIRETTTPGVLWLQFPTGVVTVEAIFDDFAEFQAADAEPFMEHR